MPYQLIEGDCSYCNLCLKCEIAERARYGQDAVFAYRESKGKEFGEIQSGARIYREGVPRFRSLDDIQIVNRLFTKGRVKKKEELGREPLYIDASTSAMLGGFRTKIPIVIAAMGSTDIANRRGVFLGTGAAKSGIVYAIGENVFNMRGYDERTKPNQPTLKERVMSFLQNADEYGGVVIQQNVEDKAAGVWDMLFGDPDLQQYFERSLIGFEAKGGQGAKPGMGGEVQVDRKLARQLVGKGYYFPDDPMTVDKPKYQRHSVPGTMTPESLREVIGRAKEKYNKRYKIPIWFKTGPYIDIDEQIEIAATTGADAITIDGTEGGTGMSPICTMDHIGWPTIKCLQVISGAKKNSHANTSLIISGGIRYGNHIVKSLALGADGVAMGRAFIIAAEAGDKAFEGDGAKGVENFVHADLTDVQQLTSSLGKYNTSELCPDDVQALARDVAGMFGIKYLYG